MSVRNFSRLEEANRILSDIIFESKTKPWWIHVNALSNYVDWLYSHSINVATISLMIASELEYREEEMMNLGVAALLHDVGMLLVPKAILQKEAPLTETEMELVKQHCELGLSSLAGFDLPKEYMDVVLQHHERMDGSGYPKKLKGEVISYNARIVMVADAVDGITSSRPYKKARTMRQAIDILREEKKYAPELIGLAENVLL